MSGGGGGGNKNKAADQKTEEQKNTFNPVTETFQPHFPGMIELISAQLGQGFGGNPIGGLDFYRPMDLYSLQEFLDKRTKVEDK